ncbi:hypothetical protein M0R04_04760 [Candidatus Dojkabacteria bacterium]|jgi:hypothetical protein|nr:hypothetical protein [Candidatus Dojkabacteria bacterium]
MNSLISYTIESSLDEKEFLEWATRTFKTISIIQCTTTVMTNKDIKPTQNTLSIGEWP